MSVDRGIALDDEEEEEEEEMVRGSYVLLSVVGRRIGADRSKVGGGTLMCVDVEFREGRSGVEWKGGGGRPKMER